MRDFKNYRKNRTPGNKKYNACVYARLSREDGDKAESDSIRSQRAMIREFISKHPEISIVAEKVDDGYSGTNFDRPGFQEMMQLIETGKVNCIVVKDLSRFGRNYIEAGNYIEKVFPFLGVRFIAITDNYDSADQKTSDALIVPFKNLINDAYCKDISVKIRTQLETKRKQGQFVSNYAPYGYLRDKEDHNHLVPDPYAAEVVRMIFRWKVQGMSPEKIAERLNAEGILSPLEYRLSTGVRIQDNFRKGSKAYWSANPVFRILQNEVYTGTLVQGKSSTPNHKIRKSMPKDPEEWVRVEGTHEAIIKKKWFDTVQRLLLKDVRIAPGQKTAYPLSGYLICADCGQIMTMNISQRNGKKYRYYICSGYCYNKSCTRHGIREDVLYTAVLTAIQARCRAVSEMAELIKKAEAIPAKKQGVLNYDRHIRKLEEQIEQNQNYKQRLLEQHTDGLISRKEYTSYKESYDRRIREDEEAICMVKEEREKSIALKKLDMDWMEDFRKNADITELDRVTVVELIDEIFVGEDQRLEIHFLYKDEYEQAMRDLMNMGLSPEEKDYGKKEQKES